MEEQKKQPLYARVIINAVKPGREEEAERAAHAGIEKNKYYPGYRGQIYLFDPQNYRSILINLWEEDPTSHTFAPGYQERAQFATSFLAEPIKPEIFEIKVFEEFYDRQS